MAQMYAYAYGYTGMWHWNRNSCLALISLFFFWLWIPYTIEIFKWSEWVIDASSNFFFVHLSAFFHNERNQLKRNWPSGGSMARNNSSALHCTQYSDDGFWIKSIEHLLVFLVNCWNGCLYTLVRMIYFHVVLLCVFFMFTLLYHGRCNPRRSLVIILF